MRADQKDCFRRLGLNIAYYRKLRGLTQERLAERVDISRTHLGRIETGECAASLEVLFDLAKVLEVGTDRLFYQGE